jgi:hypothetical protein
MTEKMVRCARCHDVFDASDEICPRCGTTYHPPAVLPPGETSYVEKYMGSAYQATPPPVIEPAPRSAPGPLVGIGIAIVCVGLVFGGLFYAGTFGSAPTPTRPNLVFAATLVPTVPPTLPPSITKAMAQFADPKFSAHITINTMATVSGRVTNSDTGYTVLTSLDATVEAGNEAGTVTIGGTSLDFMLLNSSLTWRQHNTGQWRPSTSIQPYYLLLPLFDLTDAKMLQYTGDTTSDAGQTLNHLVSTQWWNPDMSKLAVLDISSLPEKIEKTSLDLYVNPDGTPVSAEFNAWTDASDGQHLVKVTATYKFSSVGSAGPIVAPTASSALRS